jgi:hypothetical protein
MGLNIKIETHEALNEASFCGNIFDPYELINITEPLVYVCSLFWNVSKYAFSNPMKQMSLIKCKALSLAWQYPGCPVLSTFALRVLELLQEYTIDTSVFANEYEREQFDLNKKNSVPIKQCGPRTRALMARKFNLSIETQFALEKFLSKVQLHGTDWTLVAGLVPKVWLDNFAKYTTRTTDQYQTMYPPEFFEAQGKRLNHFLQTNPHLELVSTKHFFKQMQSSNKPITLNKYLALNKARFDAQKLTKAERIQRFNARKAKLSGRNRKVAAINKPKRPQPKSSRVKFSECLVRYAQASIDPFNTQLSEVCIPDNIIIPSHKFSVTINGNLVVGTKGTGYAALNPWTGAVNDNVNGNPGAINIPLTCTTAAYDQTDFLADPGLFTGARILSTQSNSMYTTASFGTSPMRLVAAGLQISYTGQLLNQSGIISLLQNDGLTPFPQTTLIATFNNNPRTRICATSSKDRCFLSYYPTNDNVISYRPINDYITPNMANSVGVNWPLAIVVSGATPGTTCFVQVRCFYEVQMPGANVTPSHGDPVGYSAFMAARTTVPQTPHPERDLSEIMSNAARTLLTDVSGVLPAFGTAVGAYFGNPQAGGIIGSAGRSFIQSALTPSSQSYQ